MGAKKDLRQRTRRCMTDREKKAREINKRQEAQKRRVGAERAARAVFVCSLGGTSGDRGGIDERRGESVVHYLNLESNTNALLKGARLSWGPVAAVEMWTLWMVLLHQPQNRGGKVMLKCQQLWLLDQLQLLRMDLTI